MRDQFAGLRIAVYARYSSDRQRETSIEDQVRLCKEYVEGHGGQVDPNLIFTDFALTGATMQRPGFESLMALVKTVPPGIDVVVTENLDRVSRDFADAATVYKVLRYAQVRMLGVSDGIDTESKSSKLNFAIKAVMADTFRDELAAKTLRGLKGRVLAGYSAGGLAFGYKSKPETGPSGQVVGYCLEIDEEQASVVRLIFRLYLEGASLSAIACRMNTDGIPPPRAHTKHRRKGWAASTIRAMLYNERYTGTWTFNEREWVRDPATGKRCPRLRPVSEVIRLERPELRIIDQETWVAVQTRLQQVKAAYTRNPDGTPKGRAIPSKATPYLLSGLLVCGQCGARLIITGSASPSRVYRCGDHLKRGTCPSSISVREHAARAAIVETVKRELGSSAAVTYLRKRAELRLREVGAEQVKVSSQRQRHLKLLEGKVANLVAFIAAGNASTSVASAIQELEAQVAQEKAALANLEVTAQMPRQLPTVNEVVARVRDLGTLLEGNPTAGKEALRAHLAGGQLVVDRLEDGSHVARGELVPLELLLPGDSGARKRETALERAVSRCGSGGRI